MFVVDTIIIIISTIATSNYFDQPYSPTANRVSYEPGPEPGPSPQSRSLTAETQTKEKKTRMASAKSDQRDPSRFDGTRAIFTPWATLFFETAN